MFSRFQLSLTGIILLFLLNGCYNVHKDPNGFTYKGSYYYTNGDKETGAVMAGKKEGLFTYTKANRKILYRGVYKQGTQNGLWQYQHPNGQLQSKGVYKNGVRVGQWEFYYPDGKVKEIRNYINNQDFLVYSWDIDGSEMVKNGTGPYKYFFENKLREKGTYMDGIPSGEWTLFDENGNITKTFQANSE